MIPLKDNIPTSRFPILTVLLIVVNVAVFAWQLTFLGDGLAARSYAELGITERDENTLEYGAIPYRLTHPGKDCAVGGVASSAPAGRGRLPGNAGVRAGRGSRAGRARSSPSTRRPGG